MRKVSDDLCFIGSKDYARRILWCVVVDRFCSISCVTLQSFCQTDGPAFESRDEHTAGFAICNQIFYRCPVWRKEKDLITRIDRRLKRTKQPLHSAIENDDVLFLSGNAIFGAQFFCND